jgi:hypothetical protein
MFKVNFSFDKHTQSHIWTCLKSIFPFTNILKVISSYFDMSNINFSFDKHTQSNIWTCLKSTFPLTNILKVIFGHVQSQIFLWQTYLKSYLVIFTHIYLWIGDAPIYMGCCYNNKIKLLNRKIKNNKKK